MTTWGIVATIKAPLTDTLRFAAYHLSQGAHRIYIYLDDASEASFVALNDHPQITPIVTDDIWWEKRGRRPIKHQVRQTRNATHCYRRLARVDWLIHMDVDEFLVSDAAIYDTLAALGRQRQVARIRPMEQLAGDPTLFKAFIPSGSARHRLVEQLYPTFGPYLKSGFLSHVAGKIFVRTGQADLNLRIHNALVGKDASLDEVELDRVSLAHTHAKTWDQFISTFRFRLEKGSYRSELAPERARDRGGMTLHELFSQLYDTEGEAGLRAFFDEVCAATPDLKSTLETHGLLRQIDLRLDAHLAEHFPDYV